jgi:hypothetical protein
MKPETTLKSASADATGFGSQSTQWCPTLRHPSPHPCRMCAHIGGKEEVGDDYDP